MAITRRQALAGFAAAASFAQDGPRVSRPRTPPKPRTSPAVCLYSQHLVKVDFESVGMVLRDLGFDGCDMAVMPGSHLEPNSSQSDLMRGIEAVFGVGLEVPILTIPATSGRDPRASQILAVAGFMGVPLFRPGYWRYANAPDLDMRMAEVRSEILSLAGMGSAYKVAMALHNSTGDAVGAALWDFHGMFRNVDPVWVGYDFDPGFATESCGVEGAGIGLRLLQPGVKAVTVRDFTWLKDGANGWKAAPCPLGEGMVDWGKFFGALAAARFTGPITIEVRYQPKDELNAFRRDLEFVRKRIAAAYTVAG
jgi:sugar phosphate isomerase/epimerase